MKILMFVIVLIKVPYNLQYRLNGEGNMCGRPIGTSFKLDFEKRIVAGYDVGYYRYPWYVALSVGEVVSCGGVLISSKVILTAAHCYSESKGRSLEDLFNLTLGMYNKCEKEKQRKPFNVEKVVVHENYDKMSPYYDIAVIFLKEDASAYQPICLPNSVVKRRPKEGTVPGMGTLRYHGPSPCTLHEARLLIYDDGICKDMLKRTGNDPSKLTSAFCGGYLQGGIDTCQGDSGGPFQIIDEFGNYVLLGLVSFGFRCANPSLLGVYTDVSRYIDWIEKVTKQKLKSHLVDSVNSTKSPSNTTESTLETPSSTTKLTLETDEEVSSPRPSTTTTSIRLTTTKAIRTTHHNNFHRFPLFFYPFFRPITLIIMKNHKLVRVVKKIRHIPYH